MCGEGANESIDHMLRAASIGHTAAKDRLMSCRIRERSIMVRVNEERCAEGRWSVSINDAPVGHLLHREATASLMLAPEMCGANRFDSFWD